jgi:3-oxoacyl-[acyl-carrier protein] reductase
VASQEAARHIKTGGRIIHIGSSMAHYASFPGCSLYTLTKGAITGFNRDLGPKSITVNTVHPGPTNTDMNPEGSEIAKFVAPSIALGRYAKPGEIANVVVFLASPQVSFVTRAEIIAGGGFSA